MRLYGERYAQLDSDRSVYEDAHRERSIAFRLLTLLFFFTPPIYFDRLSRVWVDNKINYDHWRGFISELQEDWTASITPVRQFSPQLMPMLSSGIGNRISPPSSFRPTSDSWLSRALTMRMATGAWRK